MRVAFFVVGTHGDAVPVAALGHALRARGHAVTVATSHDHRRTIESQDLTFAPLSPSYAEEIAGADGEPGLGFLRRRMLAASAVWAAQVGHASEGAELVVGSGLAMGAVAAAVGAWRGVPSVGVGVMPLTPTRAFPPAVPRPFAWEMPGVWNVGAARTIRRLVWEVCYAGAVGRLRGELGLAPRARDPWTGRMLYNFSPSLLPQPEDWPASMIRVTGAWTLPGDPAEPDPALCRFVQASEPPVVVGFGSMRVADAERARLSRAVLDGLRRSGRRAVVVKGWGALDIAPEERIMVVDHVPYDWLFPRVAAVVHHGGAGTVALAARAGVPQLVVPFVADQFFWAWQLRRLGVSPGGMPRSRLDGASLARAIEQTVSMQTKARLLGAKMRREDGVGTAIETLKSWGLLGHGCETAVF